MASLVRRMQRQVMPSFPHWEPWPHGYGEGRTVVNPPRAKHYMGRGARLGVSNPRAKDLLARQAREKARKHG